jgi:hypothetical protein
VAMGARCGVEGGRVGAGRRSASFFASLGFGDNRKEIETAHATTAVLARQVKEVHETVRGVGGGGGERWVAGSGGRAGKSV